MKHLLGRWPVEHLRAAMIHGRLRSAHHLVGCASETVILREGAMFVHCRILLPEISSSSSMCDSYLREKGKIDVSWNRAQIFL